MELIKDVTTPAISLEHNITETNGTQNEEAFFTFSTSDEANFISTTDINDFDVTTANGIAIYSYADNTKVGYGILGFLVVSLAIALIVVSVLLHFARRRKGMKCMPAAFNKWLTDPSVSCCNFLKYLESKKTGEDISNIYTNETKNEVIKPHNNSVVGSRLPAIPADKRDSTQPIYVEAKGWDDENTAGQCEDVANKEEMIENTETPNLINVHSKSTLPKNLIPKSARTLFEKRRNSENEGDDVYDEGTSGNMVSDVPGDTDDADVQTLYEQYSNPASRPQSDNLELYDDIPIKQDAVSVDMEEYLEPEVARTLSMTRETRVEMDAPPDYRPPAPPPQPPPEKVGYGIEYLEAVGGKEVDEFEQELYENEDEGDDQDAALYENNEGFEAEEDEEAQDVYEPINLYLEMTGSQQLCQDLYSNA